MTRQFYNALDALWMLRNHGMTFENTPGGIIVNDGILAIAIKNDSDMPFYPDAAGLDLLTPRVGDLVGYTRVWLVLPDDHDCNSCERYINVSEAIEDGDQIIRRGGKPFIMPQWEE